MKNAEFLAYRYLTQNEFYHIYKPKSAMVGGGGQTYIDFPTSMVSVDNWRSLLLGSEQSTEGEATQGPKWTTRVRSIGQPVDAPIQTATIQVRRTSASGHPLSVMVTRQSLNASGQNRVVAWLPESGFPAPRDNTDAHQRPEGLAIFLARTADNQVWAGWFVLDPQQPLPVTDDGARNILDSLLDPANLEADGAAGFLDLRGLGLELDELNHTTPFRSVETAAMPPTVAPTAIGESEIAPAAETPADEAEKAFTDAFFTQDEQPIVSEETATYYASIRRRNQRAVRALKDLYGGRCQITGETETFRKKDGNWYAEAHHLIPLGDGGADNPQNMIVVSPLIHRMLHYADVGPLDLTQTSQGTDGWSELEIVINDGPMTIRWHPLHIRLIETNAD